jgi:DNA recombination protein RmuC
VVVVDSKVPLEHYLNGVEAEDEDARGRHLADHAKQLRRHIQELSGKAYWDRLEATPEFVVLFLPGEAFFGAALEQDPSLIEYGVDQRVILSTPPTLIALLKAVAYGWKQEQIAQGAAEISELGRQLYDRIRIFARHFGDVRQALDQAVHAYNSAVGSLERRVLVSARRLRELGVASGDDIPEVQAIDTTPRVVTAPDTLVPPEQQDAFGDAEEPV